MDKVARIQMQDAAIGFSHLDHIYPSRQDVPQTGSGALAWSPTGQRIAYIKETANPVRKKSGAERSLHVPAGWGLWQLRWAADG
jgi:hypothetical protein